MNIFFLDHTPALAARQHCDQHVPKMIIETAQMLSTAHHVLDGAPVYKVLKSGKTSVKYVKDDPTLYKPTHVNHPSSIWCRGSAENYDFLYGIFRELSCMYTERDGKFHATWLKLSKVLRFRPNNICWRTGFTTPPCAIAEEFLVYPAAKSMQQVIDNYRNYYNESKSRFATFGKYGNPTPEWYHGKTTL